MKKKISQFVLLCLLASCSSPHKNQSLLLPGNWQQNSVIVDGNDEEWKKPLIYNNRSEKISYSITNDDKNIYILFKTSSDPVQQKILRSGLSVWINTAGQKKETAGIHFPMGNAGKIDIQALVADQRQENIGSMKKNAIAKLDRYSLTGFGKGTDNVYQYQGENPAGILLSVGYNNLQELIYEAVVPINSLYMVQPRPGNLTQAIFSVGFFIAGVTKPDMPSGMGQAGMGGMRPPPGGGSNGPPPGGGFEGRNNNSGEMQMMFSATKIWQIVPLSKQPAL